MIQGCPYLPGDKRIQSGLRTDAEVLILVGLGNLIRYSILTSGVKGRIAVSSLVRLIGVKHNEDQCVHD
eukprot:8951763-Pyramimonas_sp.AAC.1